MGGGFAPVYVEQPVFEVFELFDGQLVPLQLAFLGYFLHVVGPHRAESRLRQVSNVLLEYFPGLCKIVGILLADQLEGQFLQGFVHKL